MADTIHFATKSKKSAQKTLQRLHVAIPSNVITLKCKTTLAPPRGVGADGDNDNQWN